jgi:hypothetical protein
LIVWVGAILLAQSGGRVYFLTMTDNAKFKIIQGDNKSVPEWQPPLKCTQEVAEQFRILYDDAYQQVDVEDEPSPSRRVATPKSAAKTTKSSKKRKAKKQKGSHGIANLMNGRVGFICFNVDNR